MNSQTELIYGTYNNKSNLYICKDEIYKIIKNDCDNHLFYDCVTPLTFYVFVDNIFKDPLFIKNPNEYLKNWKIERGLTEEYRIVEDYVFGLFNKLFNIKE